MHYFKCLSISLTVIIFSSCQVDRTNDNSTSFIDERDGQEYRIMTMKDGRVWMADNLNYEMENSWCYNDSSILCSKLGRLYNIAAALKACPQGWRLPEEKEWRGMAEYYKLLPNDSLLTPSPPDPKYPFWTRQEMNNIREKFATINFIKGFGGVRTSQGSFINFEITELFWTKTFFCCEMYYHYQFDDYFEGLNPRIDLGTNNVESGLYCRCIKE